jgi:hypothetical protein
MERHTWRERNEEGLRFYRAQHHAGKWTFWWQWKDAEDWTPVAVPDEGLWRTLRELLWRKYQRRRCPWEMIEQIDKLLEKPD